MSEFLASIDRKKLWINVFSYLFVVVLFYAGPGMSGFAGGLMKAYIAFFPIYYFVYLYVIFLRNRGKNT